MKLLGVGFSLLVLISLGCNSAETPAEVSGTVTAILVSEGDVTTVGTVVCRIEPNA